MPFSTSNINKPSVSYRIIPSTGTYCILIRSLLALAKNIYYVVPYLTVNTVRPSKCISKLKRKCKQTTGHSQINRNHVIYQNTYLNEINMITTITTTTCVTKRLPFVLVPILMINWLQYQKSIIIIIITITITITIILIAIK